MESFGHYRVQSVLHHGRTGVVYLASFAGSNKMVAVKALDPAVGNDLVLRERFIRGARATSLVRSPHLATIYEVGIQMPSGHVWCAMELIEGKSLAMRQLSQEPLSPSKMLHVAKQLGVAVGAVHAGGVIHRNLKPANVMLTTRGLDSNFVRLVGFGLVKLRDGGAAGDELTARGAVVGTPAYMAPEALVDSSSVDVRADIYSFGVVLYEMLTGQLPYPSGTRSVIEQLQAKQEGPPPMGIDPSIDDLLERLLAPDREARPGSMEEVLVDLANADLDDEQPTRRDFPAVAPDLPSDFLVAESADPTTPGKGRR